MIPPYDFDLHVLVISDIEHLFRYKLVICISSLEKCVMKSFAHFSLVICFFIVDAVEVFFFFSFFS